MFEVNEKLIFIPLRSPEFEKHWGVLCPNCFQVHEIGKYSLVHPLEGTGETLVRLQEDPVTCRFCGETEIMIPQFIEEKSHALFFSMLNPEDTHLYCSGKEIQTEPVDRKVFLQLVKANNVTQ